jgi:hypothetical protein
MTALAAAENLPAQAADDDLDVPVNGVRAIAKVIRKTETQTYYALEQGYYDATKRGRNWQSTRRRLLGPPPASPRGATNGASPTT